VDTNFSDKHAASIFRVRVCRIKLYKQVARKGVGQTHERVEETTCCGPVGMMNRKCEKTYTFQHASINHHRRDMYEASC
jgi:hypothetical protein